jgi:hypothetical protein
MLTFELPQRAVSWVVDRLVDLSRTRAARAAPEGFGDSGPRNISRTKVAGFPRTRQLAGTSFRTTEPAETTTPANRCSGKNQTAHCNPASRADKDGRNL